MISINCLADPAPCEGLAITEFPATKLFRNGEPSADYLGPQRSSS